MVKDYILLKVLNTWVWILIQTLAGNFILMIIKLNRTNAPFWKRENMLVLKFQDPSILQFMNPTYPTILSGLRIVALFMNCNFTKKALRIINFQPTNFHTTLLFKKNSILKFWDKNCLEHILIVSKYLNLLPSLFNT